MASPCLVQYALVSETAHDAGELAAAGSVDFMEYSLTFRYR
ncbi:MAG: hypothetical protein ACLQMF_10460 [Rectinemataceae bacterium]